jgi:predicted O-linked N-acetylglucosamine transferase (SPINDLY family)
LWAGLPVITCAGTTFAGRVAGSLLRAVGLPELITNTAERYEVLAARLATDEALLREIREKLAHNRLATPLFDTDRFRKHIEAAYMKMWDIYTQGEPAASFDIAPIEAMLQ